jgi:hypothetical protein
MHDAYAAVSGRSRKKAGQVPGLTGSGMVPDERLTSW